MKWLFIIWLNIIFGLIIIQRLKPVQVPVYVDKPQMVEKIKEIPLKLKRLSLRQLSVEEVQSRGGEDGWIVYEAKGKILNVVKHDDRLFSIVVGE